MYGSERFPRLLTHDVVGPMPSFSLPTRMSETMCSLHREVHMVLRAQGFLLVTMRSAL